MRVAPDAPIAPVVSRGDFQTRNKEASEKISVLQAERNELANKKKTQARAEARKDNALRSGELAGQIKALGARPKTVNAAVDFDRRMAPLLARKAEITAELAALKVKSTEAEDSSSLADDTSAEGRRIAEIDREIKQALPPAVEILDHIADLLSLDYLTRGEADKKQIKDRTKAQQQLSAVTGFQRTDDGRLVQSNPVPMAEVARKYNVSTETISAKLGRMGLSDLHIGRAVANELASRTMNVDAARVDSVGAESQTDLEDTTPAGAFDASQDEDMERTSGYEEVTEKSIDDSSSRISYSAARAMGDGVVDVGGTKIGESVKFSTPEQRQAEALATEVLAGKATLPDSPAAAPVSEFAKKKTAEAEAKAVADKDAEAAREAAIEARRREIAHAANMQQLAQWSESREAANAVNDWDHYRSDAIPAFADLTQQQQLDWLKAVFQLDDRQQNDPRFIRNLQQTQERGIEPTLPSTGVAGQESNASRDEGGTGQNNQADGSQPAAKPAVVVKKRLVAAPATDAAQGAAATTSDAAPKKKLALRPKADASRTIVGKEETSVTPQRQGSATAGKMSLEEVQNLADRIVRSVQGGLSIKVMDVPLGRLSGAAEIGKGETAPDGRITVYAAAAESEIDVIRTVFHELFHRGVKRFFKSNRDYIKSMLDLSASNESVRIAAEEWKASDGGVEQRKNFEARGALIGDRKANYEALAVEEALAQLGERLRADKELGTRELRPFVRAVAQWLSSMADRIGLTKLAQAIRRMTYSELENFVSETIDRSGGKVQAGTTARLDGSADATVAAPFAKSERVDEAEKIPSEVLDKVLAAVSVNKGLTKEARDAMVKMVGDMYLQSIDEHNARTSGVRRLNRAGYDADMMRSFLSHARARAGFLANMEHGREMNTAFYEMQQQGRGTGAGGWKNQDVFNKRRYDLIPNLVEAAQKYLQHERATLEAVTFARNQAKSASDVVRSKPADATAVTALAAAEQLLEGSLGRFFALTEAYPELKADQTIAGLSEELTSTENKVAFSRQAYNDAVLDHNNAQGQFPALLIAGLFRFAPSAMLRATHSEAERDAVRIQL